MKLIETILELDIKAVKKGAANGLDMLAKFLLSLDKKAIETLVYIFRELKTMFGIGLREEAEAALKKAGLTFRRLKSGMAPVTVVPVPVVSKAWGVYHEGVLIKQGTKKEIEEFAEQVGKMEEKEGKEFLDNLLREKFFTKWAAKFEEKFHLHFDGELTLKKIDGVEELRGLGGHNHSVIGDNIQVRKYLTQPVDDLPFDAIISVRYKNGQWIEKIPKSSMFPQNWNIKRVKEEIALVYDEAIRLGKTESHEARVSNGKFVIHITVVREPGLKN